MRLKLSHPAIGSFGFSITAASRLTLGRDTSEADLELPWDPRVSRRHAEVWLEGEDCWYRDLGSRNGSFVANERLDGALRLDAGTRILLGDTTLELADSSPWAEVTETNVASSASDELQLLREAAAEHTQRRRRDARTGDTVDLPAPPRREASASLPPASRAPRVARARRPSVTEPPPTAADSSRAPAPASIRRQSRLPSRAEIPPEAAPETTRPSETELPPPPPEAAAPETTRPSETELPPPPPEASVPPESPPEATLSIRFTGPARVRIEGEGLQALYRTDLALGRLFVPGPVPAQRGDRVWIDLSLDDGLHELSTEVVHVGLGPGGVIGAGLAISALPPALRQALEQGADATSLTTVEIEPPIELLAALEAAPGAPGPAAVEAAPPATARAPSPLPGASTPPEVAQRFVSLVAADKLYQAIDCSPEATDEEVASRLALWTGRLSDGASAPDMEPLLDPLARALAMVEAHLGSPQSRLRYDFAHGFIHAERRRELAARGEGPSLPVLQSSWRRAFPAKSERARRLVESATKADESGRREEAEQLRAQARSLAPFALPG